MVHYERPEGRLLLWEVADAYGVSLSLIRKLTDRGELPVVWAPWYNGRARFIDADEARDVLTARGCTELPPEQRPQRERWTHPDGLSASEIAETFRVSYITAKRMIRDGRLPHFTATTRGGTAKFVPVESLIEAFGAIPTD